MADIRYLITVDAGGAIKTMKEFDDALDQTAKSSEKAGKSHDGLLGTIFKGVTVANLATKGINFLQSELGSFITEAVEADKVNKIFNSTLAKHGESVVVVGGIYDNFASQLQAVTGESDETIKGLVGLAMNLGINKERIKDAVQGAMGLTTAYGGSLQGNLEAVARAYQGNWRQIDMMIPEIRNLKDESEKLAVLQKKMADGFDASKSAMTGFGGELKTAANQWGDFKEAAGGAFLSVFAGVKKLTDELTGHNIILKKLKLEQDAYNWAMDEAKKKHKTYVDVLDDEERANRENADILKWMNEHIDKNGKLIKDSTKETKSNTSEVKKNTKSLQDELKAIRDASKQFKLLTDGMDGISQESGPLFEDSVEGGTDELIDMSEALDDVGQNAKHTFGYMITAAMEFWEKYGQVAQDVIYSVDAIIMQSYKNKEIAMENDYKKQVEMIENSKMTEEEKAAAMAALDETFDARRSALKAKQAKQDKAMSIVQATINTFEAASKAYTLGPIIGPIMAGVITALGLALVAKIKAQPIPMARGGIFEKPTLLSSMSGTSYQVAEAGEKEVVAPLSGLRRELGLNRGSGSAQRPLQIHLYLDGKELKKFIIRTIDETSRVGQLKVSPKAVTA